MLSRTLSPTLPCGQAAGRQVTRHPIRLTGWRVPPASAAVALPSCRGVAPDMGRTVDLGGEPSSSEISNLMLSFHERCTAATQPFLTTAPGATEFGRHLSEDTKSSTSSPVIFSFSPEKSYGRHGQDKSRSPQRNSTGAASSHAAVLDQNLLSQASAAASARVMPPQSAAAATAATAFAQPACADSSKQLLGQSCPGVTPPPPSAPRMPPTSAQQPSDATSVSSSSSLASMESSGLASVLTDEHCSVSHPGSECCTSTTVKLDKKAHECTVQMSTTVRLTDPKLHVDPVDLEELAWVAARDAAADAVSALNRRTAVPYGREERHRFVAHMLLTGEILDAKRMENGFGHVTYLVTLEERGTGRKIKAAFKPRVEGDCEGWHRVPIEAAAYQLNLLLGMDCVPPAVVRPEADVDWTHYPSGGAFIYWCGAAKQLDGVPMHEWSVPSQVLLSDTRILDVLIQNSDRHAGHFLYAEHWADGAYLGTSGGGGKHGKGPTSGAVWRGNMRPVLIDHAAGFRQDAFVCLDHENAFLTGPTRVISARTYLRLRFLDAPSLRAALRGIVTEEEIAGLLARRDSVLAFFDQLVVERGYDKVVLDRA